MGKEKTSTLTIIKRSGKASAGGGVSSQSSSAIGRAGGWCSDYLVDDDVPQRPTTNETNMAAERVCVCVCEGKKKEQMATPHHTYTHTREGGRDALPVLNSPLVQSFVSPPMCVSLP